MSLFSELLRLQLLSDRAKGLCEAIDRKGCVLNLLMKIFEAFLEHSKAFD